MNSAGHRVARVGAQYARGVDLRPAVVHKIVMTMRLLCVHKTRFCSQRYDIKTNLQAKSITCQDKLVISSLSNPYKCVKTRLSQKKS